MKLPKIVFITVLILLAGLLSSYTIYTYAVPSRADYVTLIENHNGLIDFYTIYEICKPKEISAEDLDNFGFEFIKQRGDLESWEIEVEKEITSQKEIYHDKKVCGDPIEYPNESIDENCEWVFDYIEYKEVKHKEWVEIDKEQIINAILNADVGKCWNIKVSAKRKPCANGDYSCRFEVDNILSYAGYSFDEYAWWNQSCGSKSYLFMNTSSQPIPINYTYNLSDRNYNNYVESSSDGYVVYGGSTVIDRDLKSTSGNLLFREPTGVPTTSNNSIYQYEFYYNCTNPDAPNDLENVYIIYGDMDSTNDLGIFNTTQSPTVLDGVVYLNESPIDTMFFHYNYSFELAWDTFLIGSPGVGYRWWNILAQNDSASHVYSPNEEGYKDFKGVAQTKIIMYALSVWASERVILERMANSSSQNYYLQVNGTMRRNTTDFQNSPVGTVEWGVSGNGHTGAHDNIILRKYMSDPPTYEFGAKETPNTAPTVDTPTITPTTASYLSTLNCSTTVYDVDLDTLSVNFSWYNGTTLVESDLVSSLSNGTLASDTLTPAIQTDAEVWNCTVFANDGTDDSDSNSTEITIQSRPTQGVPYLNSTNPAINGTYQNLTCWNVSTADADGDAVKNIYNWWKNGDTLIEVFMPFEENGSSASTTAKDYSGNANDGTVVNATFSSTTGVDGRGAYAFDGISDNIRIESTTLADGWSGITISAWFYINTLRSYDGIVVSRGTADNYIIFQEETSTNKRLQFDIGNGTDFVTLDSSSDTIDVGSWYHGVATWQTGEAPKIYINGILNVTGADVLSGNLAMDDYFRIGSDDLTANRFFNGTIDEVRIYNHSLSAEQVLTLYENNTHIIVSNETLEGENWKCEVTPNDGFIEGNSSNSSSLLIQTLAPSITNVSIAPAVSYTDTAIEGYFIASDVNDATVTAYCDWINGSTLYSSHSKSVSVDTLYNFSLAPAGIQFKDEVWNFSCNATDGTNWAETNSTTITILNTAPTAPTIGDPANASRNTGNSVTLNCDGSTDTDGDTIYYEFYGDADTNPPTTLKQNTTGTTYAWSALVDGATYWWRCRAQDETDNSAYTTIRQFVENNLSITYGSLNITPSTVYTNSSLIGWAMVLDTDGDSLTVYQNWTNGTTHYLGNVSTVSSGSVVNFSLTEGIQSSGETWNYSIQIWDGYELGLINSTTKTLSNSLPLIETPVINPATVYTDTAIFNCNTTVYDVDAQDSLTVYMNWTNGTTHFLGNSFTGLSNGDKVNLSLSPSLTQYKGETWNCSVRAYDGTSLSLLEPSATKTINNTAPTTPTLIQPGGDGRTLKDSIILWCGGSTDPDGDTIYYEFYANTTTPPTTLRQNATTQWYNYTDLNLTAWNYWRCRAHDQKESSGYASPARFQYMIFDNCSVQTDQALNFTFKDENNTVLREIDYFKATFEVWPSYTNNKTYGTTKSYSQTSVNSSSFCLQGLSPSIYIDGEIQYEESGYDKRSYFFNELIIDNVVNNIVLYLMETGTSTEVTIHVSDENDRPYVGVTVEAWLYDLGTDTYSLTESDNTNFDGEAVFNLDTTEEYKFLVIEDTVQIYDSGKFRPVETDYYFRIKTAEDYPLNIITDIEGIDYDVYWLNSTLTAGFYYTDLDNLTTRGCILLRREDATNTSRIFENCSTELTENLTYTFPADTDTNIKFIIIGYGISAKDGVQYQLGQLRVDLRDWLPDFGIEGVFWGYMVIAMFALFGIAMRSGSAVILLTDFGIIISKALYLIGWGWPTVILLIIISVGALIVIKE